jgi:signal transduction histidine kinase/ligand-binding sensor domain-containing protein
MTSRLATWCLASAAVLWCGCVSALSPDLTIKGARHTAWGPNQGAPLGGAVALAQTRDGYLWIAGPSGLFRFDGIAFERIELPHDPKLSSLGLMSLFASHDGGLWIGFTFGGVAQLKDGRWRVFAASDGVPMSTPWLFAETQDAKIWVATSNDVVQFDGTHWTAVGSKMGLSSNNNPILFVDSQGTIWAGGETALYLLRSGEQQFHKIPVAVRTPWEGNNMTESSSGTVWLDTGYELVPVAQNPPSGRALSSSRGGAVFDNDGTLWATTDGLRRIAHPERFILGIPVHTDNQVDTYLDSDGLTSRTVFAFQVDREGNIWVGTTQGIDRFSEPILKAPLQSADSLKVVPRIVVAGVTPADDTGGIWVTNGLDAVVRYENGRIGAPILNQKVETLFRSADGTAWFGGFNSLWSERQGQLTLVSPPVPNLNTQAIALDKEGALWTSLSAGVFRRKDGVWTRNGGITTLPRSWAITIARDRRDRLWFTYPNASVAAFDGGQARIYGANDGLAVGNVMAIYSGRSAEWFGGDFGLARLDGERFHSIRPAPELSFEGITGIVESSDGDVWLNCQSGIVHIAASELQRSRQDADYRVSGETFGAADGIVGSAATMRPLPTAIVAGDGTLWFSTSGGIYGMDPKLRVRNSVSPKVLLRSLNLGGHSLDPIAGMILPTYTSAVRFDYIALSLTKPEKVRYRYRLEGVDGSWRETTEAHQALYSKLHPGRYTFRVIAANNDGVWSESGASLIFVIPRAFAQTGWFIALCVGCVLAVIWILLRLRVRQVRRRLEQRMEDRLTERTRIARELHDSLLQGFQGLMFRLQAVRQLLPGRPSDAAAFLDSAMHAGDVAIGEGRHAVQNLRSTPTDDSDLATSLSAMANELDASIDPASRPEYKVIVEGRQRELKATVRDDAYRIAREAICNAYQHAKATHIEVELAFGELDLTVRVRDDGIGIEAQILEQGHRPGHWGLPGMRERGEEFGGFLQVWSDGKAGTEVELRIPAATAYAIPAATLIDRLKAYAATTRQYFIR